jgi:L-2,4-diaminobutyric acid acetyltransferase
LCRDFAETCVAAERDNRLVGFVTAYRPPRRPDAIFIWQIGVDLSVRRQGLGRQMLHYLLSLPACREIAFLEATVTPSNTASRRLFQSFAQELNLP